MLEARQSSQLKSALFAIATIVFASSLVFFPKEALEASTRGLDMWWNVVFPSLLPFFIVSELLIGFGVVAFLGVLLEPLMRPLFKVPGIGGFVWAMGLASGNPAGAKLAVQMRKLGKISQIEGERLAGFTNSSNPLFIFGAIAVGFFHNPALGMILALAHYIGNIVVGFLFRFHGKNMKEVPLTRGPSSLKIIDAFSAMHQERLKDGRTFGKLIGDAVRSSIETLLLIGGFIILFSVLNQLLSLLGILSLIAASISMCFAFIGLSPELAYPFISGLFEITIGAQMISQTTEASFLSQLIVVSFILGFGGFSIQAQVASILAESDIRFRPFLLARFLQGLTAACLVIPLYYLFYEPLTDEVSSGGVRIPASIEQGWHYFLHVSPYITFSFLCLFILLKTMHLRRNSFSR
ncbi:sporulation integral membrane protein YlbJ [Shouchella lehensis]|uniref:Sporulation integral membrane protein YlbJ n=1 Tax=Shouchella lehensis TaxID=300825 RepID=A0A4Y7WQY7_9BACI|nr:sporulation integral membrane protein YlbJ [Shouchella lehensis]MBG9784214.1 sporulation protein [Shouchella lehensis]RQW20773.1 sporulation integral membrane protein YlbJ [Bacillus sp. C1-1]TES50797.1 sporulation integral membrane protein YlbJ [Shouchella lehensis]